MLVLYCFLAGTIRYDETADTKSNYYSILIFLLPLDNLIASIDNIARISFIHPLFWNRASLNLLLVLFDYLMILGYMLDQSWFIFFYIPMVPIIFISLGLYCFYMTKIDTSDYFDANMDVKAAEMALADLVLSWLQVPWSMFMRLFVYMKILGIINNWHVLTLFGVVVLLVCAGRELIFFLPKIAEKLRAKFKVND